MLSECLTSSFCRRAKWCILHLDRMLSVPHRNTFCRGTEQIPARTSAHHSDTFRNLLGFAHDSCFPMRFYLIIRYEIYGKISTFGLMLVPSEALVFNR